VLTSGGMGIEGNLNVGALPPPIPVYDASVTYIIDGRTTLAATYYPTGLGTYPSSLGVWSSISQGSIVVTASSSLIYPMNSSSDPGAIGALCFYWTPLYTGFPTANQYIIGIGSSGSADSISLWHASTSGYMKVTVAGTLLPVSTYVFTATSGTTYQMELDWNMPGHDFIFTIELYVNGTIQLWYDGYADYLHVASQPLIFGSRTNPSAQKFQQIVMYTGNMIQGASYNNYPNMPSSNIVGGLTLTTYNPLNLPLITAADFQWTGAASVTTVLKYGNFGGFVYVSSQKATGTATATTFFTSVTPLPAPTLQQMYPISIQSDTTRGVGRLSISTSGILVVYATISSGNFIGTKNAFFSFGVWYKL
jgi:hypothetical protein